MNFDLPTNTETGYPLPTAEELINDCQTFFKQIPTNFNDQYCVFSTPLLQVVNELFTYTIKFENINHNKANPHFDWKCISIIPHKTTVNKMQETNPGFVHVNL